jgi:hypothetical protein
MKTLLEFFGLKPRVVTLERIVELTVPARLPADLQFIIDQLSKPQCWKPHAPITQAEQAELAQLFMSPLMRKFDVVMYNAAQQVMRDAAFAPTDDVVAQAKFAAGFVAAWQRFKSFSVIPLTEMREPEKPSDTGVGNLDQHIP